MTQVQVEFDSDVFATLRRSPEEVVQEMRLAAAMVWYSQGRVSQSRAAELAGVSRADLLDALSASGISACQETPEDLAEVLERG
jgi:predicted HTH domain antitoxin